ncbi:hypothetical protein [Lacipirellula limnantheis]|uniref:Uncharacterized protein n=1 Tax=Lacipirellula limnantheis TaxID=2528024 RepID=A0A517U1S8_9BACT|nr:hypothetical protein [Lacipirellula limnantheis]QDT74562.1 hypothetical protein I41_37590 [Lacipirellula limnantheis]
MKRGLAILAAFAIVAHWSAAFVQTIDVPPLTPLGQRRPRRRTSSRVHEEPDMMSGKTSS